MGSLTYKNVEDRTFEIGTEIYELPDKRGWIATHPNSVPVFIAPDVATCFMEKVDEVTDGKGQAEAEAAS